MNQLENTDGLTEKRDGQEEPLIETVVTAVMREEIWYAVIVALHRFTYNAGK